MWVQLFAAQEDERCCSAQSRARQQDPPAGCSPSPACCAGHACGNCKCIMTEIKGQGRTTAHGRLGWTSLLRKGSPSLILQRGMVVVSITFTGRGHPHTTSFHGMPWPCKFQNKAYFAMTQNMSFSLVGPYSLLQEKKNHFYLPHSWQTFLQPNLW